MRVQEEGIAWPPLVVPLRGLGLNAHWVLPDADADKEVDDPAAYGP